MSLILLYCLPPVSLCDLPFLLVFGRCHHRSRSDSYAHAAFADDAGRLPELNTERREPADLSYSPLPKFLQ